MSMIIQNFSELKEQLAKCGLGTVSIEYQGPPYGHKYYNIVASVGVIGKCRDDGRFDVLLEEPNVTFKQISKKEYDKGID